MSIMIKGITRTIVLCAAMVCAVSLAAQDPSAASLYNQGLEKAKAKEYSEALALMEQAMEVADPEDEKGAKVISLAKKNAARACYALGFQHRKAKAHDDAMAMFEKGAEYNPQYHSNFQGVAQVLDAKGMKQEAVAAYIKAAEVATTSGKEDKAQPLIDKAGNIVARTAVDKNWDLTMSCATTFTEAGHESASVHYALARAQNAKGDAAAAVTSLDAAIGLAGDDDPSKYYMLKGECHAKLGQKSSAVAAYGKVTDTKYLERAKYEIDQLGGGR